jgi:hypothetical protein
VNQYWTEAFLEAYSRFVLVLIILPAIGGQPFIHGLSSPYRRVDAAIDSRIRNQYAVKPYLSSFDI